MDQWEYPEFNFVMSLYDGFNRHGILPYNGSYSEQPAKIIDIFGILDQLRSEHELKIHEKQKREAERARKK